MKIFRIMFGISLLFVASSCKKVVEETSELSEIARPEPKSLKPKPQLSKEFNDYWYAGNAEITSYKLEQARYGELRDGTAVLVFVTEDFLPDAQVKADNYNENNTSVLKLNATKSFNTGLYPYSIMQSVFYPVDNTQHALKISASVQEWCGHVYTQLNNRDQFEIASHSYFQNEADQSFSINKTWTENEIWTKLRINPQSLPTGEIKIIPALEFIRLKHIPLESYTAIATIEKGTYTLSYPDLDRTLSIKFNSKFPFEITGWEESLISGFGKNSKTLTTKATKLETIKSAYWKKNSNADEGLREKLKLQ
ncbi:MAG: septum formation inhibitor Maf [Winogradskyella sp.]|uniref:septum formation inhibitor Maf n=1 Tax=Winogradskyella sp. TaxID=1883156 RepID=UPI0018477CF6|nr:septum formation inhibitor Maf [Winogradskyella sp.]